MTFPTILEIDAPEIQAYSVETIISEKFEAMIELAEANSRMKDFYDVFYLIGLQKFDSTMLKKAISATFANRNTRFSPNHSLFAPDFSKDKIRNERWNAFLKKSNLDVFPFSEAHQIVVDYLKPIFEEL
jgi:predicted nucleotidyltransferase component of viral defense system